MKPAVTVWGTGRPVREFLYVRDLADACLFVMQHYDERRADQPRRRLGTLHCARRPAHRRSRRLPRPNSSSTRTSPTACRAKRSTSAELHAPGLAAIDAISARPSKKPTPGSALMRSRRIRTMYERLYRSLYRIRRVEEEIARDLSQRQHQEPGAPVDRPGSRFRGRLRGAAAGRRGFRHAIAAMPSTSPRAATCNEMMAELYGKDAGCSRGKGGSMHLIDPEAGVMGTSAVVGTTIANAVGYAYAFKLRRQDAVVASFFGDGATEEGVFAESLNFAVLKQLPILFVCENNGTPSTRTRAGAKGV